MRALAFVLAMAAPAHEPQHLCKTVITYDAEQPEALSFTVPDKQHCSVQSLKHALSYLVFRLEN